MTYFLGGIGAFLMGTSLGIFGAGGSILTVPLLVYIFGFNSLAATRYSLFVVGLVSAFGVLREWKSGSLDFLRILRFALPAMTGMFLVRNYILPSLPSNLVLPGLGEIRLDAFILVVFAFFMITAALSMLFARITDQSTRTENLLQKTVLAAVGFLIGLLTGFLGAGGGFLIVPALVFGARFSVKEATRASLFVIMLNSIWGFFSSKETLADVPWVLLTYIVGLALVGMLLGLTLRARIPAEKLKPAFGVFVLLMGIYVLARSI